MLGLACEVSGLGFQFEGTSRGFRDLGLGVSGFRVWGFWAGI